MPWYAPFQRSTADDDLFAPPKPMDQRLGYLGNSENIDSSTTNIDADADYSPNGTGEQIINGWRQVGTNAYDKDVARYRDLGEQAQGRAAVQLDQGQAGESRDLQMGALNMLRRGAYGYEPSRAEAIGQMQSDAAIRGQNANLAGGRGALGALMANRAAQGSLMQQHGQIGGTVADQRAQEMAHAQQAYGRAAQGMMGQDIGAATTNANLEAQQRAMNEARQQQMERLGFDVRRQQSQAADDFARQSAREALDRQRIRDRIAADENAATLHAVNSLAGAATGGLSRGFAATSDERSDERAKTHIMPVGSLSALFHGRGR